MFVHSSVLCLVTQLCLSLWGFSRQEYWSELPRPPPGDLPDPGIEPRSPALQVDSLPSEPPGKPHSSNRYLLNVYNIYSVPFTILSIGSTWVNNTDKIFVFIGARRRRNEIYLNVLQNMLSGNIHNKKNKAVGKTWECMCCRGGGGGASVLLF